ncbi:hypothetical protein ECZU26_56370 [Escherichia coli]|nr:hypothetical protein ECZU26_56370 [Escherichia coli]
MVSAAALWLFIFMPGLGLLDHYLAKLFGPMNNNWLGRSNSALLAPALIGVSSPACRAFRPRREAALMEGLPARRSFNHAAAAPDAELCDHHRADLLHHPD